MDSVLGADKSKNRGFAVVFALLWGGLVLWNALTPEQPFSQSENRYLAAFPAYSNDRLLEGDFMEDMNTYLNDQFVGRPYWVGGQSLVEYALGKREINDIYIGDNALFRHYPAQDPVVSQKNTDGINAFTRQYGIPTAVMLVPSSTYSRREDLPRLVTSWDEGGYIREVYQGLDDDIASVDLCEALAAADGGPAYYRTDHHWTGYGAYLGYRQLAETLGLSVREPRQSVLSTDFLGTYHSRTGFPLVTPDVMELYEIGSAVRFETGELRDSQYVPVEYDNIYFPEYLEQKDKYSYFLGQLQPYVTIHTGADSDKRLIIFKDSYAHSLAPMLMSDYKEIRLVNLSAVPGSLDEQMDLSHYDQALFLYSTATFSQQLGAGKFAP